MVDERALESVNEALTLGIRQFKSKEYEKLLKSFTKGIESVQKRDSNKDPAPKTRDKTHPKLCSLLDSRALAYEKLGKYKLAGKDGEEIIQLDPYNCKGYLRVSKVLQLLNMRLEAYRVLSKGHKKITEAVEKKLCRNSPLLEQLSIRKTTLGLDLKQEQLSLKRVSSSDELHLHKTKRHKPPASLDPLVRFPLEVFTQIIALVPFHLRPALLLVNRQWHSSISSIGELWSRVHFQRTVNAVSFKQLYMALMQLNRNRHFKRIDFLKLALVRRGDEKRVVNTLLNMAKLQLVDLEMTLQDFSLRDLFSMIESSKLGKFNVERLEHLKIDCKLYLGFEKYILVVLPNLRKLEIIASNLENALTVMDMQQNRDLLELLTNKYDTKNMVYPKLTHFSIVCAVDQNSILPFDQILLSPGMLPNLEHLVIVGCGIRNYDIFNHPKLKTVVLERNLELSIPLFVEKLQIPELDSLYLREFRPDEPTFPRSVQLSLFSHLKSLDFTGGNINFDDLVKILALTRENLQVLNIGGCPNLVWPSSRLSMRQTSTRGASKNVRFQELLLLCPNLTKLSLNQLTNFTDFTLKHMGEIILENFQHYKLYYLDLSFNNISGHGLVEFFSLHRPDRIKIEKLVVDGNDIKHDTLKLLVQRKYLRLFQYESYRKSWRQYGVNSYSPI